MLANARKDHSSPLQNTILPQPSLLMVYYMNKKSFLLDLQFDFTVCCSSFFSWLKFYFPFFQTHHTSVRQKTKQNQIEIKEKLNHNAWTN